MIYGYDVQVINEHGLKQMREISIEADAPTLRELAAFLGSVADEMDASTHISPHWHRHAPAKLAEQLGGDFIVAHGPGPQ
ncbi:MAG: hypothetical protein GC159_05485 [Phycisphaera sp.]|nr:hypothetical protein [Phycisphaera sp.]